MDERITKVTISWTKYIPKEQKEIYEALGWQVADKLRETPHGEWSYIGIWTGEGDPEMPDGWNSSVY